MMAGNAFVVRHGFIEDERALSGVRDRDDNTTGALAVGGT